MSFQITNLNVTTAWWESRCERELDCNRRQIWPQSRWKQTQIVKHLLARLIVKAYEMSTRRMEPAHWKVAIKFNFLKAICTAHQFSSALKSIIYRSRSGRDDRVQVDIELWKSKSSTPASIYHLKRIVRIWLFARINKASLWCIYILPRALCRSISFCANKQNKPIMHLSFNKKTLFPASLPVPLYKRRAFFSSPIL